MSCIPKLAALMIACLLSAAAFAADGEAITATTKSKSIVRFGPNISAPVAGMLGSGTAVNVIGKAPGADGWYIIRFPSQCMAWMHQKVIEPINGGKSFKVTEDKARVRADATAGSQIVAELNVGDMVESQGKQIGDWYAVYPSQAIAYIYAKNLDLPKANVEAFEQQKAAQNTTEQLWLLVQKTYGEYEQIAKTDNRAAYTLDWPGLSGQLGDVIADHPSKRVRQLAQNLKDGVDRVVKAQRDKGAHPTRSVPRPASAKASADEPVAPKPAPVEKQPEPPKQPDVAKQPEPLTQPEPPKQPETPKQPEIAKTPEPAPADSAGALLDAGAPKSLGSFTAEGWLEQRQVTVPGVGHVLIDANSNITAYVKVKEGKSVQLSEYFWRLVTVTGDRQSSGSDDIPLIAVDSISMPNR